MLDHISDDNKRKKCSMNAMRLKCHGVVFDVSIRAMWTEEKSNGIRRTFVEKWSASVARKLVICDIVGWTSVWCDTFYAECMLICWCHCDLSGLFSRLLVACFVYVCVWVWVWVGGIECVLLWFGCNADDCDHITYNLRLRCFSLDVHFGAIIYNYVSSLYLYRECSASSRFTQFFFSFCSFFRFVFLFNKSLSLHRPFAKQFYLLKKYSDF